MIILDVFIMPNKTNKNDKKTSLFSKLATGIDKIAKKYEKTIVGVLDIEYNEYNIEKPVFFNCDSNLDTINKQKYKENSLS